MTKLKDEENPVVWPSTNLPSYSNSGGSYTLLNVDQDVRDMKMIKEENKIIYATVRNIHCKSGFLVSLWNEIGEN
jgi:hypothetical protein